MRMIWFYILNNNDYCYLFSKEFVKEDISLSTYVITGGTTGIGAATRKLLLSQGHEVFNIDFKGGDHLADLSSPEGRQSAVDEVFRRYPDGIDVLICNAGVGPTAPPQTIYASQRP